jgi:hypothetical protein
MKIILLSILAVTTSLAGSLDRAYNTSVSAGALIAAYHENEVRADSQFAGANVSVGGAVRKIGKDSDGDPYVILGARADDSETIYIHCRFSESFNGRIATLKLGTLINIHGTVVGVRNGDILLKECSL